MKVVLFILFPVIISFCLSLGILTAEASGSSVYVDYEYGDLKEVIVGLPYGMSPSLSAPWFENAIRFCLLTKPSTQEKQRGCCGLI